MIKISIFILSLLFSAVNLEAQTYSVEKVIGKDGYDAFAPVYFNTKIIYCSNEQEVVGKSVYDNSGTPTIDLFTFDPSSKSTSRYDHHLKSTFNDGPITFDKEFTKCVFSRNRESKILKKASQKEITELQLFSAELINGNWENTTLLPFCNDGFMYTHPTFNEEGNWLIFASNRPGGFGGYDLWKVEFSGEWGTPINLGPEINSKENELFPSIISDKIIFSSNKPGGQGGLDIYYSYLNKLSEPIPFLDSINSPEDDFGLISNDYLESGYFSSNRKGNDQIFSFKINYPEFTDCHEQEDNGFCFTLFEENASELEQVELVYQWKINEEVINGVEISYCFPGPGDYHVSLSIIDTILNQTYFEQASYDLTLEHIIQAYIDAPDTIKTNSNFQVNGEQSYLEGAKILTYYWEDGNGKRYLEKKPVFTYPAAGEFEIKLGLIAESGESMLNYCSTKKIIVSDNFIEDNSDPNLSKKIVDSTVDGQIKYFYVDSKDSMAFYSLEIPVEYINDNNLKHILAKYLQSDSTRTISVVLGADSVTYDYCVGSWKSISEGYDDWKYLLKEGIAEMIFRQYNNFGIENISINKQFNMDNILFGPASFRLDTVSYKSLNKLVEVLTTIPDFNLHISGHTDSDGNAQQNLTLSKYRVESIGKYLMQKGVNKNQLKYFYYGESMPIESNATEEGKNKNRRVEFKLTLE